MITTSTDNVVSKKEKKKNDKDSLEGTSGEVGSSHFCMWGSCSKNCPSTSSQHVLSLFSWKMYKQRKKITKFTLNEWMCGEMHVHLEGLAKTFRQRARATTS